MNILEMIKVEKQDIECPWKYTSEYLVLFSGGTTISTQIPEFMDTLPPGIPIEEIGLHVARKEEEFLFSWFAENGIAFHEICDYIKSISLKESLSSASL